MENWQANGGLAFLILGIGNKISIIETNFKKIFSEGLQREEFNLIDYEDVAAELQKMIDAKQ